ncbi:tripartite tricarboxylate transporter substrate binding protein [Verticiella sediminum]|uniref:Tripartite tricarboxylate transporter substrate binding protein n=1 Tax=Verticiella sediminum TaxID=1247510 RepID=A0A556AD01_9BURK|nr:tripartite tricarboxylate transporter substrate binding protein [Verticiella sediminum]
MFALAICATAAATLAFRGGALATSSQPAAWPNQPITIVVTFPPGGGTDLLARKLGERLATRTGQPVIVENRPGASGNVGARWVADAPADGQTLLMVNSSYAISPAVFSKLPFSPEQDFTAVINVAYVPTVIVVPAAAPARNLAEWLAGRDGLAPPYASCGNGTPQHLAGEMLARAAQRPLLHVPYRGCGPALQDVAAGQVGAALVTASSAAPFIESGHIRALAVTSPERSPGLPEVPTVAESGFPGYALDQWHGLLARRDTAPAHVQALYEHLAAVAAEPDLQRDLRALGFNTVIEGPAVFERIVKHDIERFAQLAQAAGLRVD